MSAAPICARTRTLKSCSSTCPDRSTAVFHGSSAGFQRTWIGRIQFPVLCQEVRSRMESYKYVSADSHIVEPEDLYVTRMDRRFRSRAPRAEMRNGETFMVVEGSLEVSLDADVLLATDEKHRPVLDQSAGGRHEKTRPGG